MRAITFVVSVAIAAAPVLRAQTPALPPVIRAGRETYKIKGASAAVARWLTNSPITEASGASTRAFEQIEGAYGKMVGYDVLQIVPTQSFPLSC